MKKLMIIVNPIAGGKDKTGILETVKSVLDASKYDISVKFTEYAGHAYDLAFSTDAEVVVAIGGDGTLNEVARALAGTGKTLGIIPCGSGNGLALHLGISLDPSEAARVINGAESVDIDHGIVNGNPFFCTTGVGLDAIVGWRFAQSKSRGLLTYIKESISAWFSFKPDNYQVRIDGAEVWTGPAAIMTAGNANQWGNNALIAPKASVMDGRFNLTIVKPFHLWSAPGLVINLFKGTMDRSPHTICMKGAHITVVRQQDGPFHFDGEPSTTGRTIEIEIVPSSLRVFVPKNRKNVI